MATQQIHRLNNQHIQSAQPRKKTSRRPFERFVQGVGDFLLRHWATLIAVGLGLLVLLALAIPFLSYLGLNVIAKPLFYSLHYVCAQIPSHSFYLFGHQLGLCARNLSIYSSMFLGSLIFVLSKKRLPGIPWWLWLLMILPMAWDGTTQMFGWRESDWLLRVVTGTLFGFGSVWFALPLMQKSLDETTPPKYPHVPAPPADTMPSHGQPASAQSAS